MGVLDGKRVLVVGLDAIGAGIARRFAREGAALALLDSSTDMLREVTHPIRSAGGRVLDFQLIWSGPVGDRVSAAITDLGGLDVLVNNILPSPVVAPLEAQRGEDFDHANQRVRAAVDAMQAAFPALKSSGAGRIINIGHRYGEAVNDNIAAYNAAAWSLVGLTRSAALDWGQYQIATNLLLPFADTPEFQSARQKRAKVLDLMVSQVALQRPGDPEEDIGGAALFLAGDASNFVNGQTLYADGGQHVAGAAFDRGRFATELSS